MNNELRDINDQLANMCHWGTSKNKAIKQFLERHEDKINILYHDGTFFASAISANNLQLLDMLLNFFEEVHIKKSNHEHVERMKLRHIVDEELESLDNTKDEMLPMLDRYRTHYTESSHDDDLSDLGDSYESPTELMGVS